MAATINLFSNAFFFKELDVLYASLHAYIFKSAYYILHLLLYMKTKNILANPYWK